MPWGGRALLLSGSRPAVACGIVPACCSRSNPRMPFCSAFAPLWPSVRGDGSGVLGGVGVGVGGHTSWLLVRHACGMQASIDYRSVCMPASAACLPKPMPLPPPVGLLYTDHGLV